MSKTIKIRKGLDIKLKGKAELTLGDTGTTVRYGLKPADFPGLIPKLLIKVDETVRVGTPLFYDKNQPEVQFTSPVSGKITSVNRGERRRILEIEIESNELFESEVFDVSATATAEGGSIKTILLKSGLWPFIVQRPFGVIAKPDVQPKAIFISGFDSAPLAPDYDFTLNGELGILQKGIDVLGKLTEGKVHLGLRQGSALSGLKGVEITFFDGPHPAGNVGVQIHAISPLNKGEIVWTLSVQSLVFIGRLFSAGKLNFEKIIALTGSEVKNPHYVKTVLGASVSSILENKTSKKVNERIISGNVLTGTKLNHYDFLGFFDNQLTVIPEGNEIEPFGWATPGVDKFSASKTFFSKLFPKKVYVINANYHGGERAFVLSGQYEKFLPMDILPVYLLKSIITNDIDKMEQLGIYEVIEEDLALCEYACTSKIEVQEIIRKGINTLIKETA
jgi:Na+-transporting NADH:ubiquinone oxidoreductase subunit A